jgi:hypothetical protein
LVRLLGIHAQLHGHVDGFIELGGCSFLHQRHGVSESVQLVGINLALESFCFLVNLAIYTPSTITPIERAEPAMVRTAASTSAAFMSFSLVLAISSS